MSIATNETDKQIGTILESIQAVTPEVIEEAVLYYRVMNSVWLVILAVVAVVAALVFCYCWKRREKIGSPNFPAYFLGAVGSGFVSFLALVACVDLARALAHSFIAPQHYAAECIMELSRKAFGS